MGELGLGGASPYGLDSMGTSSVGTEFQPYVNAPDMAALTGQNPMDMLGAEMPLDNRPQQNVTRYEVNQIAQLLGLNAGDTLERARMGDPDPFQYRTMNVQNMLGEYYGVI